MKHAWIIGITVVALGASALVQAQAPRSAEVHMKAAQQKAEVEGDLRGAIEEYKKIVATAGSNRALAAQALLRMAECYQKLGDTQSRRVYERLIREFGDQKQAVLLARAELANAEGPATTGPVSRQLWTGMTAVDTELSMGADGRTVAIVDRSQYPIGIRDLSTGRVTKLIASDDPTSGVEWPVLSPDMKQIAYTWYGAAGVQVRVAAVERDAAPRTVVNRADFRYYFVRGWSLDGKSILATILSEDQSTQIAWISVADGTITTLKAMEWRNPGLLALSPNGRFIAYDALTEKGASDREIRIMAADASADTVLVPAAATNESPIWTRDGKHVIFKSNRTGSFGLWSTAVRDGKADGSPKLIKAETGNITPVGFTATGSLVYTLMVGHRDVFTVDVDPATGRTQGDPVRAVDTFVGSNLNPSWSPDAASFAYISRRTDPASQLGTLVIKSLAKGPDRTITGSFRGAYAPMWLADGATILQAAKDAQNHIVIYQVDVKTGVVRDLLSTRAGGPANPTVSTDGKRVYAAVFPENEQRHVVAIVDLATGHQATIDTGSQQVKSVAASPDGRFVAFVTHEYARDRVTAAHAPQSRLYLAKSDGTDARAIFTSELPELSIWDIAWTPDSRFIYFSRNSGTTSQLWRIAASGGAPESAGLSINEVMGPLDVSPDGKRIVYGSGHSPSAEIWLFENFWPVQSADKKSDRRKD